MNSDLRFRIFIRGKRRGRLYTNSDNSIVIEIDAV